MKTAAKSAEKKSNNRSVSHKGGKQNFRRKGSFSDKDEKPNNQFAAAKIKQTKNAVKQKVHKGKVEKQKKQWNHGNNGNPRHPQHSRKHAAPSEKDNRGPDRVAADVRAMKQLADKERQKRVEEHLNERQRKHKMMTAKTRKGQPVMQGRMELMYEKIKKIVGRDPDK